MRDSSRDDDSMECDYENWKKPRNSRNVDKQEPHYSGGDATWGRCSTLMVVCAVLLCVLLLSFAIVQSIKLNNMTRERDWLQISYDNITGERDQLQISYDNMTEERDRLQIMYDNMNAERDQFYSERDEFQKMQKKLNYTIQQSQRYFTTKHMGWKEARQECRSKGADLVIINSQEEQKYLSQTFIGEAWIGLTDSADEGKWMWVDGTVVTTRFWWKGEPNNYDGKEDCAVTGSKYADAEVTTWADYPCESKLNAICEKKEK